MGWTKRQIVEHAFAELALAGFDFDLNPEEMEWAKARLDTMMATWGANGVHVGYTVGLTPDGSDLDDDSGLPLEAVEAVYMSLAVRIAGGKGKAVANTTKRTAREAYDALLSRLAARQVRDMQPPASLPLGAGNKPWRRVQRPFAPVPNTDPLQTSEDGGLVFAGPNN